MSLFAPQICKNAGPIERNNTNIFQALIPPWMGVAENIAPHRALRTASRREYRWEGGEGSRERWEGCWWLALDWGHIGPDLKRNRSGLLARILSKELTAATVNLA